MQLCQCANSAPRRIWRSKRERFCFMASFGAPPSRRLDRRLPAAARVSVERAAAPSPIGRGRHVAGNPAWSESALLPSARRGRVRGRGICCFPKEVARKRKSARFPSVTPRGSPEGLDPSPRRFASFLWRENARACSRFAATLSRWERVSSAVHSQAAGPAASSRRGVEEAAGCRPSSRQDAGAPVPFKTPSRAASGSARRTVRARAREIGQCPDDEHDADQ